MRRIFKVRGDFTVKKTESFDFCNFYKKLVSHKVPLVLAVMVFLSVFCLWQNNYITVSRYTVKSENLPKSFDGYKIVQISDLHNKYLGDSHSYIYSVIKQENPDIIVITGDIIDRRNTDFTCAYIFLMKCASIAPTYCVSGNQESESIAPKEVMAIYEAAGVKSIDDKTEKIKEGKEFVYLSGISDGRFLTKNKEEAFEYYSAANVTLRGVVKEGGFNILLAHRPEYYSMYADAGADIVFCGHAHGGQIRLPFIGGLYAPGQGFFPKYTSGVNSIGEKTQMVITRGLGNSKFPVRVFNQPEVVSVTLKSH